MLTKLRSCSLAIPRSNSSLDKRSVPCPFLRQEGFCLKEPTCDFFRSDIYCPPPFSRLFQNVSRDDYLNYNTRFPQ